MQDLTTGPIGRHLLRTTSFMLVMMVFQTLYFLVDLYWVGRLGTAAVAAVGIAGNLAFLVMALTQVLGVGTTAVVSHAFGRKDPDEAVLFFNQSVVLACVAGILFLLVGLAARNAYTTALSADAQTAQLASEYLLWFIVAMALQFPLAAMGSALRAIGNFRTSMIVASATIVLNMLLAPILIFGWGTGQPLGVAGAAISTLIAVAVALLWMAWYFAPPSAYLRFVRAQWRPRLALWRRMLVIGLPTGFEFAVTTVYMLVVYTLTRPFGAAAQAAFGIGMRVIQAGFLPVVALGIAVAPVAGQNFGARLADRVRATFRDAALMASAIMLLFGIICTVAADTLVGAFTSDASVVAVGDEYLRIIAWNFIPSGLIFVASSTFQAMGNTMPSLLSSTVRIVLFAIPALLLSRLPGFQLDWLWYLSVASVFVQVGVSLLLLRREFARRLAFQPVNA